MNSNLSNALLFDLIEIVSIVEYKAYNTVKIMHTEYGWL